MENLVGARILFFEEKNWKKVGGKTLASHFSIVVLEKSLVDRDPSSLRAKDSDTKARGTRAPHIETVTASWCTR